MKLVVGDVSSWSVRAWICLKMTDIAFEEIVIPLGVPGYKERLARYSKSMLVPVLDTGESNIHDSLAIAEYCNEIAGGKLLPTDRIAKAECRSLCCELHSGFTNIKSTWPFFLGEPKPLMSVSEDVQREIDRLQYIWSQSHGEYYYSKPTIADAFYSVMAHRLSSYNILLTGKAGSYQQQLVGWPLFVSALERARGWARDKA